MNIYTHIHTYVLFPPPCVFLFVKPNSHYYPCSLSVLPPMLMPLISLKGPIYLSWVSADIQTWAFPGTGHRQREASPQMKLLQTALCRQLMVIKPSQTLKNYPNPHYQTLTSFSLSLERAWPPCQGSKGGKIKPRDGLMRCLPGARLPRHVNESILQIHFLPSPSSPSLT